MSGESLTPTLSDIEDAARRLRGRVSHTPMVRSTWLSDLAHADVWLKLECVQTTGSYKLRGATNALARLVERQPDARVVVTASAGNHGQALAWAAREFGVLARVHVPRSAPAAKRDAMARLGVELVEAADYDAAELAARRDAANSSAPYLSPYDDPDVIAGAGTVAREMLSDHPGLDVIIAPLGGGGLLSGTAIAARSVPRATGAPRMLVVGAEAEASPVFTRGLAAGRVVPINVLPSIADGLVGNLDPESRTFGLVRDLVDRVIAVPEPAIRRAMRALVEQDRLIVEGASATAVGALLENHADFADRRVGVILSGRNVDADVLRATLSSPV